MFQIVLLCENINVEFDYNDIIFSSSGFSTTGNEYDTVKLYGAAKVSLGVTNVREFQDKTFNFIENIISEHNSFYGKNLVYCKYLSIRHSSISLIDLKFLISL